MLDDIEALIPTVESRLNVRPQVASEIATGLSARTRFRLPAKARVTSDDMRGGLLIGGYPADMSSRRGYHTRYLLSDSSIEDAQAIASRLPSAYTRQEQRFAPQGFTPRPVIAKELGVSHERVRQIEVEALLKCRAWLAEHHADLLE